MSDHLVKVQSGESVIYQGQIGDGRYQHPEECLSYVREINEAPLYNTDCAVQTKLYKQESHSTYNLKFWPTN